VNSPALISLLTLALFPAASFAKSSTKLSVTNTLSSEARTNNLNGDDSDDNYQALIDRLNLKLVYEDFTASGRMDLMGFRDAPSEDFTNDIRPERLTLQYRKKAIKLLAGDFYRQLGRGILLAIRKVDEAGLDLSLRGAQARYIGDIHRLSIFGGIVNPANLDSVSQKFIEDTKDILAGGHYEFAGWDFGQLGLMGLFSQPEERILPDILISDPNDRDRNLSGGIYLQLPEIAEDLSFYIEADYQNRHVAGGAEDKTGLAAYATVDWVLRDFVILMEGLYLQDWEQKGSRNSALSKRFDYNYGPTLERIDQEVFENIDTLGGRLRVEYLIESLDFLLYANAMLRINNFNKPDTPNLRQVHGFGGFEYQYDDGASHLYGSSGYRNETESGHADAEDREIKTMIHAEFDYLHAISGNIAFHVVSNNEFRTLEAHAYQRGSTLIGVEKANTAAMTIELGYDKQDPSESVANFFLAAILSWEINDIFHLRATAGTQRGGIKCIAGVCRDYPEFAGAKAELVTRY
jgi:hypothetical protein